VVLRSPAAPDAIPLRFQLAGGQRLRQVDPATGLPAGSVQVVDGDKPVAAIPPAIAVDAQGQSVPVSYGVDGERLVLNVDTSGDLAWPVLVDPVIGVYDSNGTSEADGSTGWYWPNWKAATYLDAPDTPNPSSWSYCNNAPSNPNKKFYFCKGNLNGASFDGGGIFIKANASQAFAATDWAEWVKYARPDSYIYQFDGASLSNVANHAQMFLGVWSADWGWETGSVIWGNGSTSNDAAPAGTASYMTYPGATVSPGAVRYLKVHNGWPTDPAAPITPGNIAVFGIDMAAGTPGTPQPYIAMGSGATYSSETYAPTIASPTHTNPVPSGWVTSYNDSVSLSANDRGLGMGTLSATGPGLSTSRSACTQNGAPPNTSGLNAQDYYDTCVLSLSVPSTAYSAPEGVNTYTATATDLVGNSSQSTWTAKVDRGAPVVTQSGYLPENDGATIDDPATPIAQGGQPYDLHVDATDESASGTRAGVRSIEIKVNGVRKDYVEQTCPAGSCPMQRDWIFTPSQYPAGTYTIDTVVRDWAGNTTTKSITVYIDRVDEPSDLAEQAPVVPPAPALVPGLKDCTTIVQAANYRYFSLGLSFEGLSVTQRLRTCEQPNEEDWAVRSNDVTFIYGDCTVGAGDAGCEPPLQIQSWPACENSRADYAEGPDGEPVPRQDLTIRGTQASLFDDLTSLEIYTGKTVIAIYGRDAAQVRRAADAVRAEPLNQAPINGPTATSPGGNLDPPAAGSLEGTLTCD
jgi:hypothetical protein